MIKQPHTASVRHEGEHPRPPRPQPDQMMEALIDSQARVITAQAAVIRFYADLVRRMQPPHGNGNGEENGGGE